ncbi:MAG: hypothetical protein ACQET5_07170 [Halobacteriota archaeon]|uniref:hypothetical protein n=1 Tax=Natronomonas sp. TaxID=2184060 RepID=UPI0039759210
MMTQFLAFGIIGALEALSGVTLAVVLLVLSVLLFGGPYQFARRQGLGTAHAVGAGIGGLGFVFLFLVALQLLHSPL